MSWLMLILLTITQEFLKQTRVLERMLREGHFVR
jgi:hypothetical protein